MSISFHTPVLLHKAIDYLINPADSGKRVIVDCTTGGGGYSIEICNRLYPELTLICIDKDIEALEFASQKLATYKSSIHFVNSNFGDLAGILEDLEYDRINGIVFDLGLSSHQLENEDGFSFMKDSPLDMRAYKKDKMRASDIVNEFEETELIRIFKDYGEIANAERLADLIVKGRRDKIETTFDLIGLINKGYKLRDRDKFDFYAKIFQALRIEVNRELDNLKNVLYAAEKYLAPGGRMVSVAYHSLEDRIVRDFLRKNRKVSFKILTGKSVKPTYNEVQVNRRARSAKLRAAEKV